MDTSKQSAPAAADPDAMPPRAPRRYAAPVLPPQQPRTAPMYAAPTSAASLAAVSAELAPAPTPGLTRTTPLHPEPVMPPVPHGLMRARPADDARSQTRFDQAQMVRQCWPPHQQGGDEGSPFGGGAYATPFFSSSSYSLRPTNSATSRHPIAPPPRMPAATSNPCAAPVASRPSSSASKQSPANNSSASKQIAGSNYDSQPTTSATDLAAYFNAKLRHYSGNQASSSASPFGSYSPKAPNHPAAAAKPPCTRSTSFLPHSSRSPFMSTAACSRPAQYGWSSTGDHPLGGAASAQQVCDYYDMLLSSLRDTEERASTWWVRPPIQQGQTLEEIRSELLSGPMKYALAVFPDTSAHVVTLLGEDDDGVRMSVLAGVKRHARRLTDSLEVNPVFLALLRACAGRAQELLVIVQAVVSPLNGDMQSARQRNRVPALKALVSAVAPYRPLCGMLVNYFVREGLLHNCRGDELLLHCFTTMPYEDTSVLIRFAVVDFDNIILSQSGSRCLAECFVNARNKELLVLEERVLSQAKKIAKGPYSNYFMQRVLEHGREELKRRLVELLMEDVASLSRDASACYVVEACFLRTHSPALLQRVLSAFLVLPDGQLAELVQCDRGNYVVHKLVSKGRDQFPEEALALARRIARLPPPVLRQGHGLQVMRIIRKLFWHQLD